MSHAKALVICECARLKGWRGAKIQNQKQIDDRAWYSTSSIKKQVHDSAVPSNAQLGIEALIRRLSSDGPSSNVLGRLRDIAYAEGSRSMANVFRRLQVFELGVAPVPSLEDVVSIVEAEIPARDNGSRWRRWVLFQELGAMMISSNAFGAAVHDKVWHRPVLKPLDLQHAT
jgi:hypothetical protein